MPRLPYYFNTIAMVVVGVVMVVLANKFATIPSVSPSLVQKTSETVVTTPPSPVPTQIDQATSTTTIEQKTATSKVVTPVKSTKIAPKPAATTTTTTSATSTVSVPVSVPVTSSGIISLDTAALALRGALVNILCYASAGSTLHSISGSGIFVDSKGIILTNAHVAQYFLLKDRGVSCIIRAGSPAADAYQASLIYISPAWIHANTTVLTQTLPSGTGEYDFALLAVTKSATTKALPPSFTFIPLAQASPLALAPVVIASYGAQFLESSQIQSSLYPTIVFGSVKEVFTFASTTIDVLALGGSAAAQEGSSGGGVADASGMLIGTITTSTVQGATDTRSLSAITASYIRSAYAREMGTSLDALLSEPTANAIAEFAGQIPLLESIITANL